MTDTTTERATTWLRNFVERLAFRPRGRDRLPTVLAWCAGLVCLVALIHRFRYAADLTDESFSMALPYRYVLGDKPFVDEISIQQTAGIVLFPFVWLFVKLTGGTTGLVLYVRIVSLVFKGAAAVGVYATARRWLQSRATAIAVSFVPFAFVPHSIPNVGYNLIGMALLTAGTFLTAAGAAETTSSKKRLRFFYFAGVAEGVMAFAYPPMAIAPLLATPLILICAGPKRWSATGAFIAGGLSAALLISPSLAFGGVAGVRRALGWGVHANTAHNATAARLQAVLVPFWNLVPTFFTYAVVGLVLAWLLRSRSVIALLVPAITIALGFWFRDQPTSHPAIETVIYTGAFAPALVLIAKPSRVVWRGFVLIVLPSFAAAVAAAFVSTQNTDAACLGLATAVALFALLAARSLEQVNADPTYCMLPAFALMLVLVMHCYDYVYRDSPLNALTQVIPNGPFKGIRTTPDRAQAFAEMSDIVKRFDAPQGRVLFLYEASGYYLFSRMKPSAHCVWEEAYGDQDGMLAYWQSYAKGRGIVVKIKGSQAGRVDAMLLPPERKIYETRHFIVYADH